MYEDSKAATKGKSCTLELLFTKVKRIVNDNDSKKLITIEMQESDGIAFYADNDTDHRKWVRFCGLLSTIPNYAIPEEPNYNLVPHDYIERFSDPGRFDAGKVFVVVCICLLTCTLACLLFVHLFNISRPYCSYWMFFLNSF